MSKDRKLDDSELADVSGAGDVYIEPRPPVPPTDGTGEKKGEGGSGGQIPPEGTESGGDQDIEGN